MFLARRDLLFAKGRFSLMVAVVALITFLVVMLSGLTAGLAGESVSAVRQLRADHLAFTTPTDGATSFSGSRITEDQVRLWSQQAGITSATPLGVAPARLETAEQDLAVTAFGADAGSPIAPPRLGDAGDLVIGAALADSTGLVPGDQVTISGQRVRVTDVVADASFNHTPVVWLALPDWQRLEASGAAYATVVALSGDGSADFAVGDRKAGTKTVTRDGSFAAIGSYSAENGSLTLMQVLLIAVSVLVVGAFFTVWTIQRSPDLAVLKAVGATDGYLIRDALAQALVVLLLGGLIGGLLAAAIGSLARGIVPFVTAAATTVVPISIMTGVGLLGAALAVRRINSVDPLSALGATR